MKQYYILNNKNISITSQQRSHPHTHISNAASTSDGVGYNYTILMTFERY